MPVGFDNRLGDNWRLLLAIAELAGDTFAGRQARQAASKLSKVADVASTSSGCSRTLKLLDFDLLSGTNRSIELG